ncbi:hypothetical protein V502_01324 [Pseudogymnoascus sp. VKM F-4520 (FW-2644)]|nr:hypothetical protein V502_01324 [Pseudogymnoascus sp. VKM F-4520 (FW-2644)]
MPHTSVSDAEGHGQTCPEVAANLKRPGESLVRDDPKKQCVSSLMSGPDNLSRLPTELRSQIFFEIADRETLVNLSRVSKPFRAVFDMSRLEFLCSAYAKELRRGEPTPSDASDAITKYIKDHPKVALIFFEAAWKGIFYAGRIKDAELFILDLQRELDTQDYDTLFLSLHTIYDHVVLETSWAAWAGAIMAIECLRSHSDEADVIGKRMAPWILAQFVSRQRELIDRGVLEGQQDNAFCVLEELRRYHQIQRRREEKRSLEWKHLERKMKHNDNLAEVLPAMVYLDVRERRWSSGSKRVREFMELEGGGRHSRHDDFHGGVRYTCYPSTCRHTADAYDLIRLLKEICRNLISEGQQVEACRAISVFGHMPRYYKHIAAERLERVRSMWHDKWPGDPPRVLTPLWE